MVVQQRYLRKIHMKQFSLISFLFITAFSMAGSLCADIEETTQTLQLLVEYYAQSDMRAFSNLVDHPEVNFITPFSYVTTYNGFTYSVDNKLFVNAINSLPSFTPLQASMKTMVNGIVKSMYLDPSDDPYTYLGTKNFLKRNY